MRVVSIGDLVLDYYYKNGKLIGVDGGMSSHNIIANLAKKKISTAVYGVSGNDIQGKIANLSLKKLNVDNDIVINNIVRDSSNRVSEIVINNVNYDGVYFRKLFDLRSTDFEIEFNDQEVIITTRGYGHGVGMSQWGANEMAKMGYEYKDILKYYYKDVEIMYK